MQPAKRPTHSLKASLALSTDLMAVAVRAAGLERPDLDSLTLACLSQMPFGMTHYAFGLEGRPESYGPSAGRIFSWLGLNYAVDSGNSRREAEKLARGWLGLGYQPLIDIRGGVWSPPSEAVAETRPHP